MRALSLFSGIGLLDLGLEWAGFRTVGLCEIEPACCWWLKQHWSGVPLWRDVREVTGAEVAEKCGQVDIVAGGFPCQPHSVAGRRKGRKDKRHLWPEFARVVREVRPRWVLAENVPGLRATAADEVLSDLDAAGYSCWPLVVGADDVGAPHRRKRVWIVARLADSQRSRLRGGRQPETIGSAGGVQSQGLQLERVWTDAQPSDEVGIREAVAHLKGERWQGEGDGRGCGPRPGCDGAEGPALAHLDGAGQQRQRVSGLSCDSSGDGQQAPRRSASCRRGEWPVGSPTGPGLEGQRVDAGQPQVPECRHAGDPTLLRGWPARPGEQQHEWEAPRLAYGTSNGRASADLCGSTSESKDQGWLLKPSGTSERRAWQPEPGLGGSVDGSARRLARIDSAARRARLKALGNGVVPQVVAEVGRAILAAEEHLRRLSAPKAGYIMNRTKGGRFAALLKRGL